MTCTLFYVNKTNDVKGCILCLFMYVLIYKHNDSISKNLKSDRKERSDKGSTLYKEVFLSDVESVLKSFSF